MIFYAAASAATLAGSVADASGAPVAGVVVVAYDARLSYATGTSGADGAWRIEGLDAGPWRLRAAPPDGSGYVDQFLPGTWDYCAADRFEVAEGETIEGLDFALPQGATFSGRLVDPRGDPVPGAAVVLEGLSARTSLGLRVAYTGEDGTFSAKGLDGDPGVPEPWACFIEADGFPQQFLGPAYDDDDAQVYTLAPEDTLDVGEQVLLDGITVRGTVYGPDGPASGGTVYVYASSQAIATTVTAEGTYIGDGIPPGDVLAWADSPGLAVTYYPDADRPGESVPVVEEGAVVDGVDLHAPLQSTFTVTFTGEGDVGEVAVLVYNSTYTVGRGSPVDDDGRVTIDGLFPGEYTMYVYGADGGFEDGWASVDGAPRVFDVKGDTMVTLALTPGARIEGVVLDESGHGVYGAYVSAVAADGETGDTVVTDRDGTYEILGLPAGTYTVDASYTHYCPADAGYVHVWWDGALRPESSAAVELAAGASRTGLDFVLPGDDDHDAMSDTWESANGLDPARDDGAEDPDGDGIANAEEYLLGTDPTGAALATGCCEGKAAEAWLVLAGLGWWTRRRARVDAEGRGRARG